MSITSFKITDSDISSKGVVAAPTVLSGSPEENKKVFDRLVREVLKGDFNALVDALTANTGAGEIGAAVEGLTGETVQAILSALKTLLDSKAASADMEAALGGKSDTSVTDAHFKSVAFDAGTGVFTFTKENGTTVTVDTALEKVAVNFAYDEDTQSLVLTLADGSTQHVSLAAFLTTTEFEDSNTIEWSVSGSKVRATIKSGSITDAMLSSTLKTMLQGYVSAAANSATNAEASEAASLGYKTAAQEAAAAAAESREQAASSQTAAAGSAAAAKSDADRAASASAHQPQISSDGYWELWDLTQGVYVKTTYQAQGPAGENGDSYTVKGLYATLSALQAAHPIGSAGDAWFVGTAEDNVVYQWDVDKASWVNVGALKGPKGKSAYDYAVAGGYTGTEAEFAEKLAQGDVAAAYVIPLDKYSISADGTNATDTTNGINQAIVDAVADGYGTIVFPKGEYLIAGSGQINITGRLTVDFNHSVLRKEANANESYVMVEISGDHNVVKNATLYGDRETHDYSSGGTHEWGIGIKISPDSRFTIIENVDVFDTTGYGMCTGTAYNQIEPISNRPLEAGCYDKNTGELVESTTHTILGYTLDITDSAIRNNMFILGGNGNCAHGITEPMSFYMTYYDENEAYLGFSRVHRLYDNIDLESLLHWYPTLRYIKFSIENTDTETNVTLELRSSYTSDDITIKNCEIARCRTLGIAITGGKRILVENVSVHDIGGAAPGYGVDIEDGYQLNQYIVFRSCEFYNNKFGDIIVVKARDVLAENCRFQGFQRPEGGTAVPTGISAYGTITSKFVVRDSVFTGTSVGGEKFYLYNCIFIDCPGMEGDFTECSFHGCSIFNLHGTTLNRCYLNGTGLRYRNGNFGCYDSVLESVSQVDENWDTGNPAEFWVMEGCLLKNCGPVPKTGVPYIRIANNAVYNGAQVGSDNYCLQIKTKQKTHCQIVENTFEQGGKDSIVIISDTNGSDVYLEGNVFKSLLTSAESVVNADRLDIRCTGRVSFNGNTFDINYMVASLPVLDLKNCVKATLTNNKFLGNYGVPIRMTSVTEAICDGNEYTGTPTLAENCKGVDIPNACSKSYVDGLIGDVSAVIASINSVVGGA